MRKRLFTAIGVTYLTAALIGHAFERFGGAGCLCSESCWCRRPGLSLFRWVAPFGHRR